MAVGAGDEVWLVPNKICGATTASEVGVAAGLGVATTEVAAETGVAAGTGTRRRSNWSMISFVLTSCSSILPWFSRILMMSGFVGGGLQLRVLAMVTPSVSRMVVAVATFQPSSVIRRGSSGGR